ncbi:J domain-containing protein [Melittangium boletus]|uniref:Molecular chaperone DnaJ n=1 Tax=Melittangium boletus DSM 14713 TaxID=1294270 RepID=A0A250I6Y7_9BACT|nr:DnaJ domain-containing protein [Melittangium boletus]ATB26953.1 molecular chaperone DnaJ [Melittangium boletus DSM 14713]
MSQPPQNGGGKPATPPPPPAEATQSTPPASPGVAAPLPSASRPTAKIPSVAPSASRPTAKIPSVAPSVSRPTAKIPSVAPAVPSMPSIPAVRPPGTAEGSRPTVSAIPSVAPARASIPGMSPVVPPTAPARPSSGVGLARPPPPPPAALQPPPPPMPAIAPLVPAVAPVAPRVPPAAPPLGPGARPTLEAPAVPPPPPTANKSELDPAQQASLTERCARLDQMDYFEILMVERSVAPGDIKKAFYRESRAYHPDRFFHLSDKELKERVNELYKRVTEAYYVLRDDAKRRQYTADISGPERAQKLRFTESSEAETRAASKRQVEEQIGTHPKGRQFYQTGAADADAGRWASAERNLKMALTYEPANSRYKDKLAEVQKVLLEESRKQGDSFKIR